MGEFDVEGLDSFMLKYVIGKNEFMEPEVLTRLGTVQRAENLTPGDPLHEYFNTRTQAVRAFLADQIRTRQECGEYRSDVDPEDKAIEIWLSRSAWRRQWPRSPEAIDREKASVPFLRILLDDLTSPSAPKRGSMGRKRLTRRAAGTLTDNRSWPQNGADAIHAPLRRRHRSRPAQPASERAAGWSSHRSDPSQPGGRYVVSVSHWLPAVQLASWALPSGLDWRNRRLYRSQPPAPRHS